MNRPRFQQAILTITVIVILLSLFQPTAVACPTCKNGLAQGQENVAQGYFWSILFMMSMPFLIFGGLGLYFYLAIRRARARQAQASVPSTGQLATAHYPESEQADERSDELVEV